LNQDTKSPGDPSGESEAARWALREAEGLCPDEKRELQAWLAGNPARAGLLDEHLRTWQRFEPLADAPVLAELPADLPVRERRKRLPVWFGFAAAACVAVAFWRSGGVVDRGGAPTEVRALAVGLPQPCERLVLPDQSVIELNRGAEVRVEFAGAERRVRLLRGEAVFAVAKDAARPFVVSTGELEAWAVGTSFQVRSEAAAAAVLVTEGVVRVQRPNDPADTNAAAVTLTARQRIVVPPSSRLADVAVSKLSESEVDQLLAWQSRLLEFDDAPLAEIVAAFNRHNPVQLEVPDPELATQRMTVTFRSDNVEGFVRVLHGNYGIRALAVPNGAIRLGR